MSEAKLEFYDLSHPWGMFAPLWPRPNVQDISIERTLTHARAGVLTHRIHTHMHVTTHVDAPAHVVQGAPTVDQVPLERFFGTGVVVSIPKGKWEVVTPDDLEKARPEIRPGDIVIVNTGWHRYYGDNRTYFVESPGFYKEAGIWFREKGVKAVGIDAQALDHPMATSIGLHPNGPTVPESIEEYKAYTGRHPKEDFPEWEPCHRQLLSAGIPGIENVGGDIDKVTGKRCTFAFFPWRWVGGDGCIVRLVAILDPSGSYRIGDGRDA